MPIATQQHRLIGRRHELERLTAGWSDAMAGARRSVLVTAPAGFGKSRLVAELQRIVADHQVNPVVLRCSELMNTVAWHPIVQLIRAQFGWRPGNDIGDLLTRLHDEFDELGVAHASLLVARTIGAPLPDVDPTSTLDPARRRALLIETLVAWINRRAQRQPTCIIVEDLHWADPSTLEFVVPLMTQRERIPLMTLATARPMDTPLFPANETVDEVQLGVLSDTESIELIDEIADGSLGNEVVERILERCDHVPLFLAEIARTVAELNNDGNQALSEKVPLSLSDSLMVRLDRLGSTRAAAAIAATIGRTFDAALLGDVAGVSEIDADIERMVESGVLVQDPTSSASARSYTFTHALVREAAYNSVTKRTRREWHGTIADAMSARSAEFELAVTAHHLTEALRIDEAIATWNAAATADFASAAYDESITHFERGLALLPQAEPSSAFALEFSLRLGVGLTYATRFGYQSTEAEQAYQRADELGEGFGGPEGFPALLGLWGYYQVRSDATRRLELAERCHVLSTLADDPAIRLEGLSALSTTLAFGGEMDRADALIQEGIDLSAAHDEMGMSFFMPQYPVAGFCGVGAPLAWSRGEFGVAWERHERSVAYAEQPDGVLGPFTAAYSYTFASWFNGLRGDPESSAMYAKMAMAKADEHGFLVWLGAAYPHLGLATALLGDPATGAQMIRDGIAGWRAAGSGLFVSYYQHALALALEQSGEYADALDAVASGVAHAEAHDERFQLAELHRLAGRLSSALGQEEAAAERRRIASEMARRQGAKLFEIRALVDLIESSAAANDEFGHLGQLARDVFERNRGADHVDPVVERAVRLTEGSRR